MLRFFKDKNGLKLTLDKFAVSLAEPYQAMLDNAGVAYVKGQDGSGDLFFKIETQFVDKVSNMINGWATAFDDLKHQLHMTP